MSSIKWRKHIYVNEKVLFIHLGTYVTTIKEKEVMDLRKRAKEVYRWEAREKTRDMANYEIIFSFQKINNCEY